MVYTSTFGEGVIVLRFVIDRLKKGQFWVKNRLFQLRLIRCGLAWEDERNKHKVKRTRLRWDIRSSWFGPGLSQIWVPMPHTNFRSKMDFFVLRFIRCRDAWKDERIKHEMKRAHLWQDIRPSYFGPGLSQNLTVSRSAVVRPTVSRSADVRSRSAVIRPTVSCRADVPSTVSCGVDVWPPEILLFRFIELFFCFFVICFLCFPFFFLFLFFLFLFFLFFFFVIVNP